MSNKMKGLLTNMALAAAFSSVKGDAFFEEQEQQRGIVIKKEVPPPKGTKEYFFNSLGFFSNEQMLKTETVFKCFSINKKNAVRKFKKWNKNRVLIKK